MKKDYWGNNVLEFCDLVGVTLKEVNQIDTSILEFISTDERKFILFHSQDCCEQVYINDVNGDYKDLVGSPILIAEESTNNKNPDDMLAKDVPNYQECFLWTFYRLSTIKGSVVIRWYGDSNGYYSVSVDFEETAATRWNDRERKSNEIEKSN